jgi:spore photoproduct lyase
MFKPQVFTGSSKPKVGKYSFPDQERINIFRFIVNETRKPSSWPIALCKESAAVWQALEVDETRIECVCQM